MFVNVPRLDAKDRKERAGIYKAEDFDFRLKPGFGRGRSRRGAAECHRRVYRIRRPIWVRSKWASPRRITVLGADSVAGVFGVVRQLRSRFCADPHRRKPSSVVRRARSLIRHTGFS